MVVDGAGQDGLVLTRRPTHRVECNATEDPCRGVTSELGVGQRRDQKLVLVMGLDERPQDMRAPFGGNFPVRDSADEMFSQEVGGHVIEPVTNVPVDALGGQLAIKHPRARLRDVEYLGQQGVHLVNDDATLLHLGDEVLMIFLGLLNPQDVIKEQLTTIARSESTMSKPRLAHHDLTKLTNLGPRTNWSRH